MSVNGVMTATGCARRVCATARVERATRGISTFSIEFEVQPPWHVYAPGSSMGLPLLIEAEAPMSVIEISAPAGMNGELGGRFAVSGTVAGARPGARFAIRVQTCDGPRCERPAHAHLTLAPAHRDASRRRS